VVDLFPEERELLLTLLEQLTSEDWARPTACPGWSVKDIALHLLGDEMGILSRTRDGFSYGSPDIGADDPWGDLVNWLGDWNEKWVAAMRRISPRLLVELLRFTGDEVYTCFKSLDPFEIGGAVSWAGPDPAPKWLDIAREYTERWVHHQQIRDALGRPGLYEPKYFAPVLAAFTRALPHTFRDIDAHDGATVKLTISGEAGGEWFTVRDTNNWKLYVQSNEHPDSHVTIDQGIAWRLFTKGIDKNRAISKSTIEGNEKLGLKVFDTVAIIA
jgi:uncharacterized protein (TIGR03083 family)